VFTRWDTVIPKFVNLGMSGEPLTVYGDGEYSRDFVHVQDIAEAIMLSLTKGGIGGETFNVGGETLTVNQVADIVKEEIAAETGGTAEAVNTAPRPGETKKFSYDLTKIRGVLGFENRWTVRKGVGQLVKHWAQQR
jgi:UDP-glucose 4-epimerase